VALGVAIGWRVGHPVPAGRAAAYLVVAGMMAAGPGLIWQMAHVAAGAVLFHAGLLGLLAVGWRDREAVSALLAGVVARRRAGR
jgi:hypothetical protein